MKDILTLHLFLLWRGTYGYVQQSCSPQYNAPCYFIFNIKLQQTDDLFISFPDPKDRMSFLPSLAGHSTHFQVGGENQKVDPSGVVGSKTRTRGPSPAENELKDFRGQKKYSPEQQKVFLLHAFFEVFLLIFSFPMYLF